MRKNRRELTESKKEFDSQRLEFLIGFDAKKPIQFSLKKDVINENTIINADISHANLLLEEEINKIIKILE